MKRTGRMRTFRRHWQPFECNKRPGPRKAVRGDLGEERASLLMGLVKTLPLKQQSLRRLQPPLSLVCDRKTPLPL